MNKWNRMNFFLLVIFVQISTHSRLLTDGDIPAIANAVDVHPSSVKCVLLQEFQTEQQFCNSIG